jgi:hypothetical protein
MSDVTELPPRKSRRKWLILLLFVAGGVVLITGILVVLAVRDLARSVPEFPSLANSPDPALQGTVAYTDANSNCVRIVAAAGQPSKEVLCLPPLDPAEAKELGKPLGPQLVWLDDGRLEVTMFRMTDPPGPNFRPGWQKIVDVRTGAVTDIPAVQAPSVPNLTAGRPVISPTGERISFTSDPSTGHATITLTDATGRARTVLDVQGPRHAYGVGSAFWSPDFRSVYADDGRILTITTGEPPVVMVLTDQAGGGLDGDQARFAVTSDNLLRPSG